MAGPMAGHKVTALCGSNMAGPRADVMQPWTFRPEDVTCEACQRKIAASRNDRSATVQAKGKKAK